MHSEETKFVGKRFPGVVEISTIYFENSVGTFINTPFGLP